MVLGTWHAGTNTASTDRSQAAAEDARHDETPIVGYAFGCSRTTVRYLSSFNVLFLVRVGFLFFVSWICGVANSTSPVGV